MKARKALVKVAAKAKKAPKAISVRISNIKAKLAKAKSPVKRAALKAQLKAAKKVAALKKALKKASSPAKKAAIKAKLAKAKKALRKAAAKVAKIAFKAAKKSGKAFDGHAYEVEGWTYLPPVVRPGTKLTQKQKEAVKARCVEVFDLRTLAQIEDRDEACD